MRFDVRQHKSLLAKLMACENIDVTHSPKATTASFDIKNRKLTLPILKDMSNYIYDGYIAHEVAHALYTPYNEKQWNEMIKEVPKAFVNITEDARIERLVQNKYPGSRGDFYQMYKDFASPERDMFGLKGKKIEDLTLIDRINIHFKIGRFVDVPFSEKEKKFVKMTNATVTFDDAVQTAKAIFKFMKEENQIPEQDPKDQQGDPQDGDGDPQDGSGASAGGAGFTQEEFDKNKNDQVVDKDASKKNTQYGEAINSKDKSIDGATTKTTNSRMINSPCESKDYKTFVNMVKPTINMMVNQFNIKKAASDYHKNKVSKSGRIDPAEISNFKIKHDIFKRNEVIFQEKNHGFVFMIDWSGSMSSNILDTYKQLLVLMFFCKKLSIPFDVYGFTSGRSMGVSRGKNKIMPSQMNDCDVFLLISSAMKTKNFNQLCETIFANIQSAHDMQGTPLTSAAMVSDIIIEDFKKRHNREKTIFVLLSDGEAGDNMYNTIIRDDKSGKHYNVNSYHDVFKYVKDHQNVSKMIGLFITSHFNKGIAETIYPDRKYDFNAHDKEFSQKRYTTFNNGVAFDKFFAIDVSHFKISDRADSNFKRIDKYATQSKVIDSFRDKMGAMKKSMVFMKLFIDEIS